MLLIRIQSYNEPIKVGENNLYGLKKKPRNGNRSGSDQVSLYLNLSCLINSEPKNELKNSQYFLGYFLAIQMDAKI